ncbi:MAG: flagellar basal body protein [Desulfobacterales bacterium]|nr:flagellar basal body protein [Desulfobacterales bacterium]
MLSSNIANADTPGYRAKDISFQGELDRALKVEGLPSTSLRRRRRCRTGTETR